jgi:hypothetical protein
MFEREKKVYVDKPAFGFGAFTRGRLLAGFVQFFPVSSAMRPTPDYRDLRLKVMIGLITIGMNVSLEILQE